LFYNDKLITVDGGNQARNAFNLQKKKGCRQPFFDTAKNAFDSARF